MTSQSNETRGAGRFHLRRRIGSGGFGVVYEAFDTKRNAVVALKTLRAFDAAALHRFKHEFRSLADVDHVHLVSLFELFGDGDEWFFTMELVDGMPLVDYVWNESRSANDLSIGGNSQAPTSDIPATRGVACEAGVSGWSVTSDDEPALTRTARIDRLRADADRTRQQTLDQAQQMLAHGKSQDEVLSFLANTLTNRLIHAPSQRLRDAAETGDGEIIETIADIYRLDQPHD